MGTQASVGPVSGSGVSAWNTTVSNVNNSISYTYSLNPIQQTETIGSDWIFSLTLQIPTPDSSGNSIVGLGEAFAMSIGSVNNGDPFVQVGLNRFVLNGGGAGYHSYRIVYSSAAETASLWVDGTERVPDYLHNISLPNGISGVEWGEIQGGPASANWNLVSLQIVPEPSTLSLVLLASGVLLFSLSPASDNRVEL